MSTISSQRSGSDNDVLSMRIITTEHTLEKPLTNLDACRSSFRNTSVRRVPVIHLFGATLQGRLGIVCNHI